MELIEEKELIAAVFDLKDEIFIVYVTFCAIFDKIHLFCRAYIILLKVDEAPRTIVPKYSEFANVFFPEAISGALEVY